MSINTRKIRSAYPKLYGGDLTDIALGSFGQGMTRQEVLDHILPNSVLFVLLDEQRRGRGFAGLKLDFDYADLTGAVLGIEEQKMGFYRALTRERIEYGLESATRVFKTRTQNPRVEAGICSVFEEITREMVEEVGRDNSTLPLFEVTRQIVPSLYGRMLTSTRPFSSDEEINAHYAQLDYERGDAFELTFEIPRSVPNTKSVPLLDLPGW